jgi:hypothetical protein
MSRALGASCVVPMVAGSSVVAVTWSSSLIRPVDENRLTRRTFAAVGCSVGRTRLLLRCFLREKLSC